MKITGHKTIIITDEDELRALLYKVVEFSREYQKVEIDKFVCEIDNDNVNMFEFSVELRGESEIETKGI